MNIGRAHREALKAHDIAFAALCAFWDQLPRNGSGPKLSTEQALALCQLSAQVEAWQERIRIHRRVPLPGTARPKPAKAKVRRERPAPGARARPAPPVPDVEPAAEEEQADDDPAAHGGGTPDD